MARAEILKCCKILSTISGNSQRAYGAILTSIAIHQKGQAQDSKNKKVSEEGELLPTIQANISGITPSANSTQMIVGDSSLDQELAMSTL